MAAPSIYKRILRDSQLTVQARPPVANVYTKNARMLAFSDMVKLPAAVPMSVLQNADGSFKNLAGYDTLP